MDPKKQKLVFGALAVLILGMGAYYTLGGSGSKKVAQTTGEIAQRKERKKTEETTEVKRKERKTTEAPKEETAERKVREEKEVDLSKRKEKKARSEKIEKKKTFGKGV